jgi:hypothetical protein
MRQVDSHVDMGATSGRVFNDNVRKLREGKEKGTVQRTGSQSAAVLKQVRDGQWFCWYYFGFTFIL